jgi:phage shock protein A
MALLERVATLIRANLNDLIEQAEDPEKLAKQLLLDMQNQYMQVKTQVAMAITEGHLLERQERENRERQQDWVRKAELAVARGEEDLARAALERSLPYENAAANFSQQREDQDQQLETLQEALGRLEQKMAETKARVEVLVARHRRARMVSGAAHAAMRQGEHDAALEKLEGKASEAEAMGAGHLLAAGAGVEQRLNQLERSDRVERLLAELKERRGNG